MSPLKILSTALAVLAALSAPAAAQDWAGAERAQGVVLDLEDNPIAGATVTLSFVLVGESGPEPMTTNKKGRWSAIGLKPGPWKVLVEAEGYIGREANFTVFDTGANRTVEVKLAEIPEAVKDAERRARANELLTQGNEMLADSRLDEARSLFEQVLALVPEDEHASILAGIASTHFQAGEDEKGKEFVARALAIEPENEAALRLKVAALAAEGKEEEAARYRALLPPETELDPNAEINLGVARYNAGDLESAGATFERVRTAHPELPEPHYYCGLVYLGQGNNEKALEAFREFLRLAPEHEKAAEAAEFVGFLEPAAATSPPVE